MDETVAGPRPRIPTWIWDLAASALVVFAAMPALREPPAARTVVGWIAVLLPAALLLARRRFPWVVLAACAACFCVAMFTFPLTPGSALAVAIALYTVTVRTERRRAIWTTVTVAILLLLVVVIAQEDLLGPVVFLVLITLGFAAALGDAVRTRRAYIQEITQRAIRAEATREAEASRRVAEDRLRIARDLHDAVAHQISVISLNAGVATSALDERPEVAREALLTIRTASRTVLGAIGDLLATLRMPGDAAGVSAVGLSSLDTMVAAFRESGLDVSLSIDGDVAELPPAVDVVAYRVIQESLTNALKHGSAARANVQVTRDDGGVHIVVVNPATAASLGASTGHGLIGIRERVDSVRGAVRAGESGGTYRLQADLPVAAGAERPS